MVSRVASLPALKGVRGARFDDAPAIRRMINETMKRVFDCEDIRDVQKLIETSVSALCLLDVCGRLAGFIAVKDYPLVPAMHPSVWEEFIWLRYKIVDMNSRNSLFIHLLCWEPAYGRAAVDGLLRPLFMMDLHLMYVAFIKQPPDYPCLIPGQMPAEASFKRVNATERGAPDARPPALYVASRADVSPRLRVRRAVEQDNDDIIPIIERQSPRLRALYGEFYVSELVSRHPESERVLLVCEHNQLAVGVMCLNTAINYNSLEDNFDLTPFAGLRKVDPELVLVEDHEHEVKVELIEPLTGTELSGRTPLAEAITRRKVSLADDYEDAVARIAVQNSPVLSWRSIQVDQLFEDDEDIDFDIINIDESLFTGSQILPTDEYYLPSTANTAAASPSFTNIFDQPDEESERNIGSRDRSKHLKVMRFSGHPNAFLMELFAMHPDYDERHGFDMLEASFELFSGRDYCVLSLPTDHPTFPLLEHFTFVRPICCKNRFKSEALYVAHINSVRGTLGVRTAENYDLLDLDDLLEHVPSRSGLTDLFRSSLESSSLRSFMFLSEKQPVGFAVVGALDEGASIRALYALDQRDKCIEDDGAILAAVLSSVFEPHSRWFLRELMRYTDFTTLFWTSTAKESKASTNLMMMAGKMVPIRPRLRIPRSGEVPSDSSRQSAKSTIFGRSLSPVWYVERPITCMQKVDINTAIMVVGASNTALAFLETILTGPSSKYLNFTNITLVSEHGWPVSGDCLRAAETCVPRVARYNEEYTKCVPFHYYVDFITGVMEKIDRRQKCIYIKGGITKYYDELVLTCGEQFQHPDYLKESLDRDKEFEKGKPCERILMDDPLCVPDEVPPLPELPGNVMIINSVTQANVRLRRLLKLMDKDDASLRLSAKNPIMVYGDCIEAYSCLTALLQLDISPKLLTFVEPFPSNDSLTMRVNCFNNETVDKRVQKSIEDLGITVCRSCTIIGWITCGGLISAVKLISPKRELIVPCFALFYYGVKGIDLHTFTAIVQSGLVYDGGTVISTEFNTNDPHVFAAGPGTRIERAARAPLRKHSNYHSEDVGEALGQLFLKKFDPYFVGAKTEKEITGTETTASSESPASSSPSQNTESTVASWKKRWRSAPTYDSPIWVAATLPGPLYYLKVRPPGPEMPMEVQMSLIKKGHVLVTDRDGNYFRLELSDVHKISAVTCLSRKLFVPEQLVQLYGKHESLFHHLLRRFSMSMIEDMFCYFSQSWMSAIYQEAFVEALADIDEPELYMKTEDSKEEDKLTFREKVRDIVGYAKKEQLNCTDNAWIRLRAEARSLWREMEGEKNTIDHIGRYLQHHGSEEDQYSKPILRPDFYGRD